MTKPWISDAKQRASKKYRDLHAQLALEVAQAKRPALRNMSAKQARHFAKNELHRLFGDSP